jgi:hypothetical protein
MLPQDFGAVLPLADLSGGIAFHSKPISFFLVEEYYSLTQRRHLSASILLNGNMPLRDACTSSYIVFYTFFKTFALLAVCPPVLLLFSDYNEGSLGIAVVMQLLIWFLKSATQDGIYTSFIGLFYGPVFPAALGMANDILPGEVHMVVMALM